MSMVSDHVKVMDSNSKQNKTMPNSKLPKQSNKNDMNLAKTIKEL
jgi:hypothetical protein